MDGHDVSKDGIGSSDDEMPDLEDLPNWGHKLYQNYVDGESLDTPLETDDDVKKYVFVHWKHAHQFYVQYGRRRGFDIRRTHRRKDRARKTVNVEWECVYAGKNVVDEGKQRVRNSRESKRCGCEAKFRVARGLDGDKLYYVSYISNQHNHPLATRKTAHRLKCNSYMTEPQKFTLYSLNEAGIRPRDSIKILEQDTGGPGTLPFRPKSVYNYLYKKQAEQVGRDGDANTALALLDGMKINDPDMKVEFKLNPDDEALSAIFWSDGFSQASYNCFGDVLVFDSTYKTNKYGFPLVIMSGVDNHLRNCIFGAALMCNETIEAYIWLLRTFKKVMGGKNPVSVLTDQDAAMRSAISVEFPEARHRLCSWHLMRNCMQKVKNQKFTQSLGNLLKQNITVPEFEQSWAELTEPFVENKWLKDLYDIRDMWGEAYFHRHFTGMMSTTQRAESLNSQFKDNGKAGNNITSFLKHYHVVLGRIRSMFLVSEEESEHEPPYIRPGAPLFHLEKHASSICTNNVFKELRIEILREQALVVVDSRKEDNKFSGTFTRYISHDNKEWTVEVDLDEKKFLCSCTMLETDGLPCRHLFSAFKALHLTQIPTECIWPRWTKRIGKELLKTYPIVLPAMNPQIQKFVKLQRDSAFSNFVASQSESRTKSTKRSRFKMYESDDFGVEDDAMQHDKSAPADNSKKFNVRDPNNSSKYNARDPRKVASRGARKGSKQRCGTCGELGHKGGSCLRKCGTCGELGHKDGSCLRRGKNGAKKMNKKSKDEVDNDPDDMNEPGIDDIENEL